MSVETPDRAKRIALLPLVAAALIALAVAGCSRTHDIRGGERTSNHVSPPPVEVPRLPPGSFDQARAGIELRTASEARAQGDTAGARRAAEAAVAYWPGDVKAWAELMADYDALSDEKGLLYATFFHDKVDFAASLPPRAAVLGFASLAAGRVGMTSGAYVYDQRTLDTALRLASFYDERDRLRDLRAKPSTPTQNTTTP